MSVQTYTQMAMDDGEERETVSEASDGSVDNSARSRKARVDEIIDDEFNIHSTVGLVSALLLSCLASSLKDARSYEKQVKDCEAGQQTECIRWAELYKTMIFFSMTCALKSKGSDLI